jgi:hypothetical protein
MHIGKEDNCLVLNFFNSVYSESSKRCGLVSWICFSKLKCSRNSRPAFSDTESWLPWWSSPNQMKRVKGQSQESNDVFQFLVNSKRYFPALLKVLFRCFFLLFFLLASMILVTNPYRNIWSDEQLYYVQHKYFLSVFCAPWIPGKNSAKTCCNCLGEYRSQGGYVSVIHGRSHHEMYRAQKRPNS